MDLLFQFCTSYTVNILTTQVLSISEPMVAHLETDKVLRVTARYICVIEKESIFSRLVNDPICNQFKILLVTGIGFPSLATRKFLKKIALEAPTVPILGLFDYNPGGFKVFQVYKLGSFHPESIRYGRLLTRQLI